MLPLPRFLRRLDYAHAKMRYQRQAARVCLCASLMGGACFQPPPSLPTKQCGGHPYIISTKDAQEQAHGGFSAGRACHWALQAAPQSLLPPEDKVKGGASEAQEPAEEDQLLLQKRIQACGGDWGALLGLVQGPTLHRLDDDNLELIMRSLSHLRESDPACSEGLAQSPTFTTLEAHYEDRKAAFYATTRAEQLQELLDHDPADLVTVLKVYVLTTGAGGEADEGFQSVYTQAILARLDELSIASLAGLVKSAGVLHARQGWPGPPLLEAFLNAAASRLSEAGSGEEWMHLALASARLPWELKLRPAGARFDVGVRRGLEEHLPSFTPQELVTTISVWPKGGLDVSGRSMIRSVVRAAADQLGRFTYQQLADLALGLKRPLTSSRQAALQGIDDVAERMPDFNPRVALLRGVLKLLARRLPQATGGQELAALSDVALQELSFREWVEDFGPGFPRAFQQAVLRNLPTLECAQLLPILSSLLFCRALFDSPPSPDFLTTVGAHTCQRLCATDTQNERDSDPRQVLLPLLCTFALLAGGGYDPGPILAFLTDRLSRQLDALSPPETRLLLEALALPGHSYVPPAEVLGALSKRAAQSVGSGGLSLMDVVSTSASLARVAGKRLVNGQVTQRQVQRAEAGIRRFIQWFQI